MSAFLEALQNRVLVFDGAFGTWVQDQPLTDADFGGAELEGCNENLVFTRPDLIATMHDEFLQAGVDAIETATFGAFPIVLAEYNISEVTRDLNRDAARLAIPLPIVLDG
jgi:5-methyltetrahydrofolate--homocysteine methyltransferase